MSPCCLCVGKRPRRHLLSIEAPKMAQDVENTQDPSPDIELEGSTYEIIRNRLNGHAKELRSRLGKLNESR